MGEAIIGIRQDGEVRAVFAIDGRSDEREATTLASQWLREGRTVKRCSQEHAFSVMGRQWEEPVKT